MNQEKGASKIDPNTKGIGLYGGLIPRNSILQEIKAALADPNFSKLLPVVGEHPDHKLSNLSNSVITGPRNDFTPKETPNYYSHRSSSKFLRTKRKGR